MTVWCALHSHRWKTFGKTSFAINLHMFFLHYPLNITHWASTDIVRGYNLELIDTQRSMCTGYVETLLCDTRDMIRRLGHPWTRSCWNAANTVPTTDWWGSLVQMKPQLLLPSSFKPFLQKIQSPWRDCCLTLLMWRHAVSRVQPKQEGPLKQGFKLYLMCVLGKGTSCIPACHLPPTAETRLCEHSFGDLSTWPAQSSQTHHLSLLTLTTVPDPAIRPLCYSHCQKPEGFLFPSHCCFKGLFIYSF